jgi:DNA-directed RNA polymerase subunit L
MPREREIKVRVTETQYQQAHFIARQEDTTLSHILREALARMLKARAKTLYGQLPVVGDAPNKGT